MAPNWIHLLASNRRQGSGSLFDDLNTTADERDYSPQHSASLPRRRTSTNEETIADATPTRATSSDEEAERSNDETAVDDSVGAFPLTRPASIRRRRAAPPPSRSASLKTTYVRPPPGYEPYSPSYSLTSQRTGLSIDALKEAGAKSTAADGTPAAKAQIVDRSNTKPVNKKLSPTPNEVKREHDAEHTACPHGCDERDEKKGRRVWYTSADAANSARSFANRLPPGGEDALIYNRRKVMQTVSWILFGWTMLIVGCFGFKVLALRYDFHAPDRLAEYVNAAPTASTQWFTFAGVLLGEIALILWGHSIGYMAFRRLAYGKERTELLTYAAWNEMSRAGYTLSRRRPLWPICTVIIFIANTFLPAGFSTLLSPKQMIINTPYSGVELDLLSPGFAAAIGFLPASTFPNPANLSCGSQFVSNFWTFASHPSTIFDPCPSLDDVQMLIMAGRAKLEASVNQSEPLFKLPGSLTFVGGTGGIASLGPLGILPWGSWDAPPPDSPTPKGYNYTYTLYQQGLSVDVSCWQPKTKQEHSILTTETTGVPHLLKVSLKCGADEDADIDVSYHYIGSSSIILKGCTSKNAKGLDDADATVMYFKDAGASVYGTQGSELGGDFICELKPKWTRNQVEYVSDRNWIRVTELDTHQPPNRLTGFHGELGPGGHPFSPTSESSKKDFFDYYTRLLTVQNPLSAVGNAFAFTSSLSAVINGTGIRAQGGLSRTTASYNDSDSEMGHGNSPATLARNETGTRNNNNSSLPTLNRKATDVITTEDLRNTVLFGKDSAIQSLAAFNARVNAQKVQTWIQPSQVEIFIRGVFEYAATSQREWFQHYAVDGGGFNGPISLANGTRLVTGTWHQQTVGWGASTDNPSSFIFYSLIPMLCFALVSIGMIAWSHWYDAHRDVPYAPDIDPTDWLEAVVASSQGGLTDAFPRDVLGTHKGRIKARKVRIRLGQIFDGQDPKPRLGFVCVD